MKNFTTIILVLIFTQVRCQLDKNGNPVFNSITIAEEELDGYTLSSNYYTLNNNIDNIKSSVYVSEKPTIKEREKFATDLPSDFFLLSKKLGVSNIIVLQTIPKNQFLVLNLKTSEEIVFSTKLKGDITENRANELIKGGFDANARIENGKLYFNNKKIQIITAVSIKKAVKKLIKKEKLNQTAASELIVLSQAELKDAILIETKTGGQLDFFTEIKGKEFNAVLIKKGVITTNLEMALYKWGRATYELGLNTFEDSYIVFSKHKERELNKRELNAIKSGFNKTWEK